MARHDPIADAERWARIQEEARASTTRDIEHARQMRILRYQQDWAEKFLARVDPETIKTPEEIRQSMEWLAKHSIK